MSHGTTSSSAKPVEAHEAQPEVVPTPALRVKREPGAALSYPASTLTLDPLSRERLALEAPVRTGYYAEDIGDGCVNDSGFDA